jgi:hypothetical protein
MSTEARKNSEFIRDRGWETEAEKDVAGAKSEQKI